MWIENQDGELYNLSYVSKVWIQESSNGWAIVISLVDSKVPQTNLKTFENEEQAKQILKGIREGIQSGKGVIALESFSVSLPPIKPRSSSGRY